jgi:outer membrane lipoprotein-sorting protein
MISSFNKILLFSLCLCSSLFIISVHADQHTELNKIIKKQKAIKTLSAGFTQEKHSTMLKDPLISGGSFLYKAPDKVAWIYTDQIQIVSDGKELTVYYEQLKEAEIVPAKNSFIRLPLSFNLWELRQYFRLDLSVKKSGYIVTLVPIDESSIISKMIITLLDNGVPDTVEMLEKGGDKSIIRFKEQKVNKDVADKIFDLDLPKDTVIRRFQQ